MILFIPLACLIFASFFAGLETGLLSADKLEIYSRKEKGIFYARVADYLLSKPERLLGTTLIGTNISVVTSAVILNSFLRGYGIGWLSWAGSFGLSVILLIFSEIIPKSFFRRHADTLTVRLAPALGVFYLIFLPVSFILNRLVLILLFISGQYRHKRKGPQSRDDFRLLVKLGSREAGLKYDDFRVFEDIFDFRETLAKEVMMPLHDHPVCRSDRTPHDLARLVVRSGARYIPIFRDRSDDVIGYVDGEDLLGNEVATIKQIMREAVFYPETKRIPDLLMEMNQRNLEVIFLADEYGAVSGIVTAREIASEIVGFIPGEEREEDDVRKTETNTFMVSGTADLEHFFHATSIAVKKQNSETVGGYLCEMLGRIPKTGEVIRLGDATYTVRDADERRILSLEVRANAKK